MQNQKFLFKSLALVSAMLVVFAAVVGSSHAAPPPRNMHKFETFDKLSTSAYPATAPLELMASTVRIQVKIRATRFSKDNMTGTLVESSWAGSGVVYDKTDRANGPVRSRILSANHVLETPAIGSIEKETINFLGMEMVLGEKRIDAVEVSLQTADGRVCKVEVLTLGSSDTHDVAVAEADCDAGRVAELGNATPVMGELVYISGYSLGVPLPMLTEGYVSGWMEGYLLTSAPAFGGNSGGPVFHNGKVIGLLVRGSREYPNLTLTASLEECLRRIAETPPLQL